MESYISEFSNKTFTVAHNIWNGAIAVEGREVRIWGLFDTDDTKLKAGVIPVDFKKCLREPVRFNACKMGHDGIAVYNLDTFNL